MTVSSETRKAGPFDGNGATVDFPFEFKVFSASDVRVVVADSDGFEATKTLLADYTVALNADQNANPGGTITMLVAPATGETLAATSALLNTQPTDITNAGGFYPQVIEDALDRQAIQIQQVADQVSRSFKTKITDTKTADEYRDELLQAAADAATQAGNAAASAAEAAVQVGLAEDQVALAAAQVSLATVQAGNSASSASASASSASSASGSATLSMSWATQLGSPVSGGEYSAKHWAQQAAAYVAAGVIDDGAPSAVKAWSSQKVAAEIGRSSATTYTYTSGVLTGISETLPGGTRTTTLTYSSGVLTTMVVIYAGVTRTTTYTYTSGVLTSTSTVES
ncbi:hypothetical protein J5J83_19730 [Azoarcus sp. L1K30]|uniref:hypothetical protein n=1 Tax=Azoarcus sp. L1K30 TaxID=2820277 RepID=UPI001B812A5A|nr:hypothetical protein [Azoarcus sp. L1K30]MBR0568358.1 hypothetical protein [Azoarcus sp. L1K30]